MKSTKTKGRPSKDGETRKAVTFRLTPSTIAEVSEAAKILGISQSDFIANSVKFAKKTTHRVEWKERGQWCVEEFDTAEPADILFDQVKALKDPKAIRISYCSYFKK